MHCSIFRTRKYWKERFFCFYVCLNLITWGSHLKKKKKQYTTTLQRRRTKNIFAWYMYIYIYIYIYIYRVRSHGRSFDNLWRRLAAKPITGYM